MRWWIVLLLLVGCSGTDVVEKETLEAERFIRAHLQDEGWLRTDLNEQRDVFLSESVGLWMAYAVKKQDRALFEEQVEMLEAHFLLRNDVVSWRITEEPSPVNALIDDLRIVESLYAAQVLWGLPEYGHLARRIGRGLVEVNSSGAYLVDYEGASTVTLSYIVPGALDWLQPELAEGQYEQMRALLVEAPLENGFFPQTYDVAKKHFLYNEDVNLIDQYYIGYHRAQWGADVEALVALTRELLARDGVLYGRVTQQKEPAVDYEAGAVYALAVLMMLEIGEKELAQQLFTLGETLRVTNGAYAGGVVEVETRATHFFDNVLLLLAERGLRDAGLFKFDEGRVE